MDRSLSVLGRGVGGGAPADVREGCVGDGEQRATLGFGVLDGLEHVHRDVGHPHLVLVLAGLPFFGISILAGLQTIPVELHESATIDGAGTWGRFRYVTLPSLLPVIFIVTTFSIVITFFDFQLVYVLTGGGPAGTTSTFATAVYETAFKGLNLGRASAIGLIWMALLLLLVVVYVRLSDRETT